MKKILFIISLLFIFVPHQSFALKCQDVSNADALKLYDGIFLGKVISITDYKGGDIKNIKFGYPAKQIKFKVTRTWKGNKNSVIDLVGLSLKDMWEPSFEIDKSYVVYGKKEGDVLIFPVCGISKQVSADDKIINTLDNLISQGAQK